MLSRVQPGASQLSLRDVASQWQKGKDGQSPSPVAKRVRTASSETLRLGTGVEGDRIWFRLLYVFVWRQFAFRLR